MTEDDERVDGPDPRFWKVATVDFSSWTYTRILKTRFLGKGVLTRMIADSALAAAS